MENLLRLIRTTLQMDQPIDRTTPLLSSGLVDSFDMVLLLTTLEDHYDVVIPTEQVGADTVDTPQQLLDLIERIRA